MNIWERLEACKKDLTPAEMKVCKILEENPYPFHSFSATRVAQMYKIPQASITRFIQRLGFSSYSEFRMELAISEKRKEDDKEEGISTGLALTEIVAKVRQIASKPLLDELSDVVIAARHVFLGGTGNQYIQAYQLMVKLTITEIQSTLLQPGFETQSLHTMKREDVVILFSHMNPTYKSFLEAIKDLPENERPYTVLIYSTPNHPVRKLVDFPIELPTLITGNTISQGNEFAPVIFNLFFIEHLVERIRKSK